MKKLITGNEAVARALWESGGRFISAYPGTPSTEITEYAAKYDEIYAEWAPNEKVALEAALGASLAGSRAIAAMKMVGVNIAADPLLSIAYTGVSAGLVLISADDPQIHSSQNEQDNRHYPRAAKVPMLEPSDSQETLEFTKKAFEISEEYDIPVMVRLTTRICHGQSLAELGERDDRPLIPYEKKQWKYNLVPTNARPRHKSLVERLLRLAELSEKSPLNRMEMKDTSIGVICAGACYQYVKEALPEASVLKIGFSYPLPQQMIKDFAAQVDRLYVVEELDPVMETEIKSWGIEAEGKDLFSLRGEISHEDISKQIAQRDVEFSHVDKCVPPRPPLLCSGCPHRGTFYVFHKMGLIVTGDIGCYTLVCLPPIDAMDTGFCMGSSIGVGHGMSQVFDRDPGNNNGKRVVAAIGESTFIHSGITPLINVAYNESDTVTVILDNGITAMTGHQPNPTTGFNAKGQPAPAIDMTKLCQACGIDYVVTADPFDLKGFEKTVQAALDHEGPAVIIAKRPCILLDKKLQPIPLDLDAEKCIGCGLCLKLGCPALGMKKDANGKNKAFIEPSQCVDCGLCEQVCPTQAMSGGAKGEK
ncbi:MAG: indolepyruvate ferredoxin oxidoreductase subunit alpha [Bacillota bacterium]|jgi:indolepyruvate ferredoxin oxidoreductase alpha subunit